MSKPKLNLKATFNIKTKEFIVKGKGIHTLKVIIDHEWEDYWDSVNSIKTGEPIYDVNLFFDDFAEDGSNENNPKNYQAQYVNLTKKDGQYHVGSDYTTLPLRVTKGEFEYEVGHTTIYVKDKNGKVLLKTKSLNRASDFSSMNKEVVSVIAVDGFGFEKKLK